MLAAPPRGSLHRASNHPEPRLTVLCVPLRVFTREGHVGTNATYEVGVMPLGGSGGRPGWGQGAHLAETEGADWGRGKRPPESSDAGFSVP